MARFDLVCDFIGLFYWIIEMKTKSMIEAQSSDLSILGRNATFCLVIDHLGLRLGVQIPIRTLHLDHHIRGLSLDHLVMF